MNRFAGCTRLTRSEAHVLALVESGLSNREIAAALSITIGTVKCNLHRVYEKLQVGSRLEAVTKARERADRSSPVTTASIEAPLFRSTAEPSVSDPSDPECSTTRIGMQ